MLVRQTVYADRLGSYTADQSLSDTGEQERASIFRYAQWLGKGKTALGLPDTVKKSDLRQVALGYTPTSHRPQRLRNTVRNPNGKERIFLDFNWHPPKSVTIGALIFDDVRLLQVHRKAVVEMAELIEDRYVMARVSKGGVRHWVQTNNLLMLAMERYTNMPVTEDDQTFIDPQLRTHLLIMNSTLCPDGKYRALHAEVLNSVIGLGQLFRQTLALKVQALGYQIRQAKHGFELADINDQDIEVFSKRTNQGIEKAIARGNDLTPANIKHHIHASQRSNNIFPTLERLQQQWREEARDHSILAPKYGSTPVIPVDQSPVSEELDRAIDHLSKRLISFSKIDLEYYIFALPKSFSIAELWDEFEHHRQVIRVDGGRFSTVEGAKRERDIRQRWMAGQGKVMPLTVGTQLAEMNLCAAEHEIVVETLSSQDSHQIWQSLPPHEKVRTLKALEAELEAQGKKIKWVSITEEALLPKEIGITTQTINQLASATHKPECQQIWIIDKAGQIGSLQLQTLLQKADRVNARILLVGSKGTTAAAKEGYPFVFLPKIGATTHSLIEIRRKLNNRQ